MGRVIEIEGEKFEVGKYVDYMKADKSKTILCQILDGSESNRGLQLLYRQGNRKTVFFVNAEDIYRIQKRPNYIKQPTQEPIINETPSQSIQPQPTQSNSQQYNQPYNYSNTKNPTNNIFSKIKNALSTKNINLPQDIILKELLVLLALIAHALDWAFIGLSIDPNALQLRFIIYFVLIMLSAIIIGNGRAVLKFTPPALFAIFVIPLIDYVAKRMGTSGEITDIIAGFALILPIYALYLVNLSGIDYTLPGNSIGSKFIAAFKRPSGYVWLLTWGLFLVAMIYFLTVMIQLASFGSESAGISDSGFKIADAWNGIKETFFQKPYDAIIGIGTRVNNTYTKLYNDSLGEYYTGQVEQNKELTGVFITEIRTMGTYYEGQPIELFATLKMRSFVDEINMTTNCYAKDVRGNIAAQGITDPKEITNVFREDYRGVKCTFNPDQNLTKGRYDIFFEIEFNFETWAYITMSIMDRDFLTSLYMGDVDILRKYNIQPRIRTIYTNGPVMLGLNDNMEMPFAISTKEGQTNNLPVGITIDDRPQAGMIGGEIINVNSFQLRVPPQFEIKQEKCIMPTGTKMDTDKDEQTGYTIYSFIVGKDYPGKYLTVSCNAEISNSGARSLLSDPTGKRDITIAGSTTYKYKLAKRTSIDIRNI